MTSALHEAITEAWASAPDSVITLDCLEIDHHEFTEPLRVVRWPVTGPELERFFLKHEDNAPLDPGQIVEYAGFPWEITMPESSTNARGAFNIRVALYNDFDKYLEAAAMGGGIIRATYRQYIKGREAEGPAVVWPGIEILSPRREGGSIIADGGILRFMSKPYGNIYLPHEYPALVMGR